MSIRKVAIICPQTDQFIEGKFAVALFYFVAI